MVSKNDLVDKFIAVTGTDKDTASHMLEACSNNLETAVTTFLDGGVQSPSLNGNSSSGNIDSVRAPIPQTQGVLVDDFRPTMWRYRQSRSVFDGFRSVVTDNGVKKSDKSKKLKKLEELFRPPVDMMHEGTFQSARDAAMKENKWLMVNIQNVSEFSCQELNRDVWKSKKVKSLVKDHFLFWQESCESSEGEWYSTFYTINQWPHVCVIDPRTGGRLVTFSNFKIDSFVEAVNEFLADHGSLLDSNSHCDTASKKDLLHMNEDEQLAAAIAASLNETRYQERSSPNPVSDSELAFTDEEFSPSKSLNQKSDSAISSPAISSPAISSPDGGKEDPPKKKLLQKIFPRKRKRSRSDAGPFSSSSQPKLLKENSDDDDNEFVLAPDNLSYNSTSDTTADKDTCSLRILFKHPDGKREELCFNSNANVKDLTSVVSRQYDLTTHELIKNFPRKIISSLPGSMLLEQADIFDKDTLFIQEKL